METFFQSTTDSCWILDFIDWIPHPLLLCEDAEVYWIFCVANDSLFNITTACTPKIQKFKLSVPGLTPKDCEIREVNDNIFTQKYTSNLKSNFMF